jgi:hypothetical protein
MAVPAIAAPTIAAPTMATVTIDDPCNLRIADSFNIFTAARQ